MKNKAFYGFPKFNPTLLKTSMAAIAILSCTKVAADVATDGSLGAAVNLTGANIDISAELGQSAGNNLFHSFESFSLSADQTATFSGPDAITNVFSRVTGGSVSNINGTIQDTFTNANFYFLNPAGIMIGPNASLNVSGSFFFSTADYLQFSDDTRFIATTPSEDVSLTAAPPQAFGFNSNDIASISIEGSTLTLAENKQLSLVGGDIVIIGANVQTPQGNIEIVSSASAGEVVIADGQLTTDTLEEMGNISIVQSGLVSSGINSGGDIRIQGGQIVVNGSALYTYSSGLENSGDISLEADTIEITNETMLYSGSFTPSDAGTVNLNATSIRLNNQSQINTASNYTGDAGAVQINAEDLAIDNASYILSYSEVAGDAGNVTINVEDTSISNSSKIITSTYGAGNAGSINIEAEYLTLQNDAELLAASDATPTTIATGNGADVNIRASELQMDNRSIVYVATKGSGSAGNINIEANDLSLGRGSQLRSQSLGAADAGDINIALSGDLTLGGESEDGRTSRLVASTGNRATIGLTSNAGNISIQANNVMAENGAVILARTYGSGSGGNVQIHASGDISLEGISNLGEVTGIGTEALPISESIAGDAGSIELAADNLTISEGAYINTSAGVQPALIAGTGSSGEINIELSGKLSMQGTSLVGETLLSSEMLALVADGNGRSINIDAADVALLDGAQIRSSNYGNGNAGNINLNLTNDLFVSGNNIQTGALSGLFSSNAPNAFGSAGDISVNANNITLKNGGAIWSNGFGYGDSGAINLQLNSRLVLQGVVGTSNLAALQGTGSSIATTANSQGQAGNISIVSPEIKISDGGVIASSTYGSGHAGNISIAAEEIFLAGHDHASSPNASSLLAFSSAAGQGGDIRITTNSLALNHGAEIVSRATGQGNAGDIRVDAETAITLNSSSIQASSELSDGGNVTLNAVELLWLKDSQVTTSVNGETGRGGNISIDPLFVLLDNSIIRANAFGGFGGNIDISADQFIASPDSIVEAVAKDTTGVNGTILINSPDNNISAELKRKENAIIERNTLENNNCWNNPEENLISLKIDPNNNLPTISLQSLRAPNNLGYDTNSPKDRIRKLGTMAQFPPLICSHNL
ncbi:MAG: filamentous hemagglutinin N-terminal domain-containing protein [Pseudomonadales bacterium]|nr:filamentous hemagglutinin N-terminal domain-containing protein [Pseudomonadales bacterium]